MRCEELHALLTRGPETIPQDEETRSLTDHLRTCSRCQLGLTQLAQALIANDTLSCDQCRQRLPSYYEALRPDYPLVKLSEQEARETILHLSHCTSCQDDYRFLVATAEREERDVMPLRNADSSLLTADREKGKPDDQ